MIIDIQKQRARMSRRNALRTYIISAAHRGTNSDGTEWNDWSVTGEVYAVVTSTSPFDALMDYLRSRPDVRDDAQKNWSYARTPSFIAGQRVWAVINIESYSSAQRLVRGQTSKELGLVRYIAVY